MNSRKFDIFLQICIISLHKEMEEYLMSGTKSTRLTPKLYAKLQGDSTNNIKVTMETIESLRTEHKLIEDDINNKKQQ